MNMTQINCRFVLFIGPKIKFNKDTTLQTNQPVTQSRGTLKYCFLNNIMKHSCNKTILTSEQKKLKLKLKMLSVYYRNNYTS